MTRTNAEVAELQDCLRKGEVMNYPHERKAWQMEIPDTPDVEPHAKPTPPDGCDVDSLVNAAVAEKVMKWRHHRAESVEWMARDHWETDRRGYVVVDKWNPLTSPTDDYEVLKKVRESWSPVDQRRMSDILNEIWAQHRLDDIHSKPKVVDYPYLDLLYEPGDYARAALAVVEGEEK